MSINSIHQFPIYSVIRAAMKLIILVSKKAIKFSFICRGFAWQRRRHRSEWLEVIAAWVIGIPQFTDATWEWQLDSCVQPVGLIRYRFIFVCNLGFVFLVLASSIFIADLNLNSLSSANLKATHSRFSTDFIVNSASHIFISFAGVVRLVYYLSITVFDHEFWETAYNISYWQ